MTKKYLDFKMGEGDKEKEKEWLDKEQPGNSEPFPVTNLPVYLINSEQIGISERFCDDQKVL